MWGIIVSVCGSHLDCFQQLCVSPSRRAALRSSDGSRQVGKPGSVVGRLLPHRHHTQVSSIYFNHIFCFLYSSFTQDTLCFSDNNQEYSIVFFVVLCRMLGKWPNTYTFTKAIAEHVVADTRSTIPTIIFRPSIGVLQFILFFFF
jgi:hypothetical protein